jgi:hypothetical protein
MRPFIGTDDLSAVTGTEVTDDDLITAIALDAGCQAVRSYIGQTINYVEDDVEELDGNGRLQIRLKERPIRDLTSVAVDGNLLTPEMFNLRDSVLRRTDRIAWPYGFANVVVTYSHGWDAIPDDDPSDDVLVPADLRLVALLSAKRVYTSVGMVSGTPTSETIGSYSYSLSSAAESAAQLLDPEKAVLDLYRIGKIV